MQWLDWLVVIIPLATIYYFGLKTRCYLKDASCFLSAGRVCGRYVISMGNIANALSILGLLAFVEIHYKTGFAVGFWGGFMMPLGVVLGLFGYCTYRFRETKAQSIGQFFEMRYSRKFRVFAAALRSLSELLANMIMPALAARFFIYLLDLPESFRFMGITFSTFDALLIVTLFMAISIIWMGGAMSIIVTDTIQGFICYPLMAIFVVIFLCKFSWSNEVLPVIASRVQGESFLNPYDTYNLKDFNVFSVIVMGIFTGLMHQGSWIGAGGSSNAARSPHEQKMAYLLGTWRHAISGIFYVLIAVALLTFLNHNNFQSEAHQIRINLTQKISEDLLKNNQMYIKVTEAVQKQTPVSFHPESDRPMSEKENVDAAYLNNIHKTIVGEMKGQVTAGSDAEKTKNDVVMAEAKGNKLFQQFRTLYYQQMLPVVFRKILPTGVIGLFCLLMIVAMISTDDSRIFSATVTISQDVILPFVKKPLNPQQHLWLLRVVALAIGVFFAIGSKFMAQLDYIRLYVVLVTTMWLGGCGPVIIFGLYSRFGNVWGAWVSLVTGAVMAVGGTVIQRNWADQVVPFLQRNDLYDTVGFLLEKISAPMHPLIVWKMDAVKCPVNSYEWYFVTMIVTLILYCVVSKLTGKEKFNLDRMLHRGIYAIDGEKKIKSPWTRENLYRKFVGITPEYTFWDRVIAWAYFYYSIVYRFGITFVLVIIWNFFYHWPISWWGWYFLIVFVIIPGLMAAFTAVWFGICGVIDLRRMFHDLESFVPNKLDNGQVEGHISLADKAQLDKIDAEKKAETGKSEK